MVRDSLLQTIVNDVNEAIGANSNLEDSLNAKLELEKTLLLANYGPLCLNPKPSIAIANQKLHYSKYFLNTHKLRYKARKHTLLGIAQRKRLEQHTKCSPSISGLIEFIAKKKVAQASKSTNKVAKKPLPVSGASGSKMRPILAITGCLYSLLLRSVLLARISGLEPPAQY